MSFLLLAASHTANVHPVMIAPFVILLLSIAVGPILFPHFWHKNYPKIAVGLGLITIFYYFFVLHNRDRLLHVGHEYLSFIALIGALFVTAGGIHITVKGQAKPLFNVAFLFFGAVIANLIGTTGASMVLIRPWLRMNRYRITTFHIVFFIFIVSNVGGCLTPIGDPPLFLGYLKGIPFFWIIQQAWLPWLIAIVLLLAVFYVLDRRNFAKPPTEVTEAATPADKWVFQGMHNIFFIALILAAVLLNKILPTLVPEFIMLAAAFGSFKTTPDAIHEANHFDFEPIKEVAWLFVGIFATMIPALDYLAVNAADFSIDSPMKFYWFTGVLSAFIDNAPTYLTFLTTQMGLYGLDINLPADVLKNIATNYRDVVAISLGAVFFGAFSYIGNGPNLMVKAIADYAKVKTPSFFGYIFCYSVPFLLPILAIISILFFSPWKIF